MTLSRAAYQQKNYGARAFLWGLLVAACIVLPVMIYDRGYFLYYGDFNVQQIPFYRLAHDTVLSGDMGWSHLTDLGANFVGSYSFYLLGSPFFWLTMALPSTWVAYAIGPLLILKLGCCSLAGYLFLRRYVSDRRFAVLGGLLYAFSGFSVYNVFFFHFHEAMIIFPLLLAALDEFQATKRTGIVAVAIFFAAVVNYYFFFGQAVFLLIYYVLRLLTRSYRFSIKDFGKLAAEVVIGVMLAMFLLFPSIAAITDNYRTSQFISGWNAVIYPNTQRYVQILVSMFFPGDLPARANFTPSAGGKWSSVAAYLPMVSTIFVIAFFRKYKKSFWNILLTLLLIMAVVPALNSAFQAMNRVYYARWFYMLTLVMILMTIYELDHFRKEDFRKGFIPTAVITGTIAAVIGLTPNFITNEDQTTGFQLGLEESAKRFWIFVIMTVVGLVLTYLLYRISRKNRKALWRMIPISLSVFIVGYSSVFLWAGKYASGHNDSFMISNALNYGEELTLDDVKTVRSDFYHTYDNMGIYWQIPGIQAFHSIVPGALMDFYNCSGVKRDVGSRPDPQLYGFRALLSVKYLFAEHRKAMDDRPSMPYFEYLRTENGYDIYENQLYLPMGFTFERFISEEQYREIDEKYRHLALLKAMVLTEEQLDRYAYVTRRSSDSSDKTKPQNEQYPQYHSSNSVFDYANYTKKDYKADVERLRENTCSRFEYVKGGFEADFTNRGKDNLLFFSVPYDKGWTAYVNGEKADIEVVDIGMMAVRVKGHTDSHIEFRYTTPMLREGIIISLIGAGIFVIYLIIYRGFSSAKPYRKHYRIKNRTNNHKEGVL